jgi:hypothetical protein
MLKRLVAAARIRARSGHVGFVVNKLELGQVFSKYFGFPRQLSSPGAGTTGQLVADVANGPSWTPPPPPTNRIKKKKIGRRSAEH